MDEKLAKSIKFSITIAVITFVLAAIFSTASSTLLGNTSWYIGLVIVLIIVLIGIVLDMLGIAATAANEAPLHAMAAEKVIGAKEAVQLNKHADKFASFCNDVIGDISGIVSGSALTIVIIEFVNMFQSNSTKLELVLNVILTSIVAALTVGGKAVGKYFAINQSEHILLLTGKVVYFIETKLKITVLPKNKRGKK